MTNKHKLKKYREKRNFKKTPEPGGKVSGRNTGIFVIQKHDASHLHYDLRLEIKGVLVSFAIPKGPCLDPAIKRLAVHVEDHPMSYATFEGVIPQGEYGGGTVMLWDKGKWVAEDKKPYEAYLHGHLTFTLKGVRLKGRWKLIRMNNDDKTWLLIKINDKYAKKMTEYNITKNVNTSVITGDSMEDIARQYYQANPKNRIKLNLKPSRFPSSISPQLATLVDAPPVGKNWLHEIKLDGYRILALKKNNSTKLYTRNGHNWTRKFPHITEAINRLPISSVILDGEIIYLNQKNHSDFQSLQHCIKKGEDRELTYYIFDLLYYDQYNLMSVPLIKRKKILMKLSKSFDESVLRYNDHITGKGKTVFARITDLSLEGMISKDAKSHYIQKRSKSWLKIKCRKKQTFVIGGFTHPKKSRQYFGSLLLGTFNKSKKLVYHGHVGSGFTVSALSKIYKELIKYATDKCPFTRVPPECKTALWIKPVLVAEIEFTELTSGNILRHPVFKGIKKGKKSNNI